MRRLWASGFLGSLLLLCGGLILSPVPSSSWVVRWQPLERLREAPQAVPFAWALLVVGCLLMTEAWWSLGKRVRGRPDGVVRVFETVAVWTVPLLVGPPLFSKDAWSYVADGYLTGHGLSPYVFPVSVLHGPLVEEVSRKWLHTLTPYGPVTLLWGGWFSRLTSDPWLLMLAQRLLAVIGLALLGFAVPRLARYGGRDPATATWLVLASPFLLISGIADLHNDLLMAGLMSVALLAGCRWSWIPAAVLGGLAAAVKAPGGAIELGVVLVSLPLGASVAARLGRALSVGAVGVATVVGVGAIGGLGVGWLGALGVPVVRRSPMSVTTDLGRLSHAFMPEVRLPLQLHAVRDLGVLVLAIVVAALVLRGPTGPGPRAVRAAALVMLAVTVLSPVVRPWYFLWCLPLLGLSALPYRSTRVLVLATAALGVLEPLSPGTVRWRSESTIAAAALLAVVMVGVAISDPPPRSSLAPHEHQWS